MKMKKLFYVLLLLIFISCSLEKDITYIEKVQDPEFFQSAMQNLTDIVVYDIFSPPVASRVYLYPIIAMPLRYTAVKMLLLSGLKSIILETA